MDCFLNFELFYKQVRIKNRVRIRNEGSIFVDFRIVRTNK